MEKKKTKILAIGDIHGDKGLAKKLSKKIEKENIDIIILAGDFSFFEEIPKGLISMLSKKPILILHGNHERFETSQFLSKLYPNVKNIHGYSFKNKDIGIFGAGGAIEFNTTEKEIFKVLEKANKDLSLIKKKILVTHMHPKDSKSEFSGFQGSKAIKRAIKEFQPDIALFAHIHEAAGIEEQMGKTKLINVSRKEKIFEI